MTTKDIMKSIDAATSLDGLLDALRDTRRLPAEVQSHLDFTNLPTFGGGEPSNTSEVWSWDAQRLIVGSSVEDMEIIGRADWRIR